MTIKREVGELEGVKSVEGDEQTKMVTVEWENPATWDKIANTLKEAGYPAEV
jgi:copper chaperone CopZ